MIRKVFKKIILKEIEVSIINLSELKRIVDYTIEHLDYDKPEDIPVLITLKESSLGSRAASAVKYIGMGFDWESGQFRIEPVKELVTKGNSLTNVKTVVCRQYDGRNYYFCPRCQSKISRNDHYCRDCGQKLK
jgi:YHS domain-containing protein